MVMGENNSLSIAYTVCNLLAQIVQKTMHFHLFAIDRYVFLGSSSNCCHQKRIVASVSRKCCND